MTQVLCLFLLEQINMAILWIYLDSLELFLCLVDHSSLCGNPHGLTDMVNLCLPLYHFKLQVDPRNGTSFPSKQSIPQKKLAGIGLEPFFTHPRNSF